MLIGFGGYPSTGCEAGTSVIPTIADLEDSPTPGRTGAKWDTDGGVYYYPAGNNFPGARNGGTWIGDCDNTQYEGRWTQVSGDAPTTKSQAVNVWTVMSTDLEVTYSTGNILFGIFIFELRRTIDSVTILTDTFTMDAESADE